MAFFTEYETGLIGKLTLASDGENIIGCWFENDRLFGDTVDEPLAANDKLPVFERRKPGLTGTSRERTPTSANCPSSRTAQSSGTSCGTS